MFRNLLTLSTLSALPLLAELSYFPAHPAKHAPKELVSYKSELMEAMRYRRQREKALQLIKENRNDCVNDEAVHDGHTLHDLTIQPDCKKFKPGHSICVLPEYTVLVSLSEK